MSGLLETTRNFSLYGIPAAWLISHCPHLYAATATKCFDNRFPRDFPQRLEADQSIDQAKRNRVRRAHAAGSNGYENLGLFAAAVVAGNVAGLSHYTLNALTGGYLISRVVYNFIYVNNTTEGAAATRSVVFLAGIGHIFTLFIKSGNVLRNGAANLL
ncbi:hypothetical protein SBOR_4393 [Sclerotinia borealis F-4128]|uniref:Uncharacterized protein n=1 Tax=Sclerotinia borealis (strain F-4128) TaxID=1432307 RepID=W9CKM3_SCLBF|nr:hypothetical protein SBOR_4393 [Sclerotinia borealis F-4128]